MKQTVYPRTDGYFSRIYLGMTFLCFATILVLVVIGDVFHRTDDFAEYAETAGVGMGTVLHLILRYYAAFAPSMVIQEMLPLVMVLGAVLTVSLLSAHNEYVAMWAAGVSMRRLVLSILLLALLLGGIVALLRDTIIPPLVRSAHAIASTVKPRSARPISLSVRDGDTMHYISMGYFDSQTGHAYNLWVEIHRLEDLRKHAEAFSFFRANEVTLRPRMDVDSLSADDPHEWEWVPGRGARHVRHGHYGRAKSAWQETLPTLVTPALLERHTLGEAVMQWSDLQRLYEEDLDIRIAMHRRLGEPFACLLVCLVVLPLVMARTLRGSDTNYINNIIVAVTVCGFYYLLRIGFLTMAEEETLPPFVAVWLPNLLFAAMGGLLFWRMETGRRGVWEVLRDSRLGGTFSPVRKMLARGK